MKKKLAICSCLVAFSALAITIKWFHEAPQIHSLVDSDIILLERISSSTNVYVTWYDLKTNIWGVIEPPIDGKINDASNSIIGVINSNPPAAGVLSNQVAMLKLNRNMRLAANMTIPMGIRPGTPNEAEVLATAKYLHDVGLAAYGYNVIGLDFGWAKNTLDANGVPQADPVLYPHGISNLVQWVKTNDCYIGLYAHVEPNGSYNPNYAPCVWPTNAYACGKQWGSWGIRTLKMDGIYDPWLSSEEENQYRAYQLINGLDDGSSASAVGYQVNVDISSIAYPQSGGTITIVTNAATGGTKTYDVCLPSDNTNTWLLNVVNGVYQQPFGDGVTQPTIDVWQQAVLYTLTNYSYIVSPQCYRTLQGFFTTNVASHWTCTTNVVRMGLGTCAIGPLPLSIGSTNLTPMELQMLKNRQVVEINQDPLRTPCKFLFISDQGGAVFSRQLANGDIALGLWNMTSNSINIGANLQDIPGVRDNKTLNCSDVFDNKITNISYSISASVNPYGFNLYRIYAGQVSRLASIVAETPAPPVTNLVANMALWYRADNINATNDSTQISWVSITTNGGGSYTLDSTNRPTFYTNVIAGHSSFYFTNNQILTNTWTETVSNYTAFFVYKATTTNIGNVMVMSPNDYIAAYTLGPPQFRASSQISDQYMPVASANDWIIGAAMRVGGTLYVWGPDYNSNVGNPGMLQPTYVYTSLFNVGKWVGQDIHGFIGYIPEVLLYDKALTFEQVNDNLQYFHWYYGF